MRVGVVHIVLIALVALVAALAVSGMTVEAKRYILTDGFSGPDDSAPDANKWVVDEDPVANQVIVYDGRLVTNVVSASGHAYCLMARSFSNDNITVRVEFTPYLVTGRMFELTLLTEDEEWSTRLLTIRYDAQGGGWGYIRLWEGKTESYSSGISNTPSYELYLAEMNLINGTANFTVWDKGTGEVVWMVDPLPVDPTLTRNRVYFGVKAEPAGVSPYTVWDNFTLFDPNAEPNVQPQWVNLPAEFYAVEDVVYIRDFNNSIVDDQEPWELALSSPSPYVVATNGFRVSFLFPNNVTRTSVQMVVSDGYATSGALLSFRVTPVNDPPSHSVPEVLSAIEGMPLAIDLSPHVWDIDNIKSELTLVTSCEFATVDGLMVTLLFPEGLITYDFTFGISDGELVTNASIYITITPVDSPPYIAPIPDMEIPEDEDREVNLTKYISDIDTPIDDLFVVVYADHGTLDGFVLLLNYPMGGEVHVVTVHVTDGTNWVEQNFTVTVGSKDDPPQISDIPAQHLLEGEIGTVRIIDYVYDEEVPKGMLRLTCDDPNVLNIRGLNLTLLYEEWVEEYTVEFTVSDGVHTSRGHFNVSVSGINDEPVITGIGDLDRPYMVYMVPGTTRRFDVRAHDDDDTTLYYDIESVWSGFRVQNSTLMITAKLVDLGSHSGNVVVSDARGGVDRVPIGVKVMVVEDLPIEVAITSPSNHTIFEEGHSITLTFSIYDPEGLLSRPVTIIWSVDGTDGTILEWPPGHQVVVRDLATGSHTVNLTVNDGNFTISRWIIVQVGEGSDDDGVLKETYGYMCILVVVIIIIVVLTVIVSRLARTVAEPRHADLEGEMAASQMAERSLDERQYRAKLREDEAREARIRAMQEREERRKAAKEAAYGRATEGPATGEVALPERPTPTRAPEPAAGTALTRGGPLPKEQELEAQLGGIRQALEALPDGLPSELSLFDAATIAKRIVRGRKRWSPDGGLLAFVQGAWYYADPADGRFMQRFVED